MFKYRSKENELMDLENFDEVLSEQSFRFIENVNRFFGGIRIVKKFVFSESRRLGRKRTLRILDMGSGSCDIPVEVCKKAVKSGIPLEFTCIETNLHAVTRARKLLNKNPGLPVRILQEDIFQHTTDSPYDIAIGSMFFHHLQDQEILTLIEQLRTIVKGAVMLNDLERCWPNYIGALLLTLPESPGVRNDALVSVRKGFTLKDLSQLLGKLPSTVFKVKRLFFYRIAAVIRLASHSNQRSV
ncbi:methyltransferase domain-containing protein [Candidatus Riflebacteria bacterium]